MHNMRTFPIGISFNLRSLTSYFIILEGKTKKKKKKIISLFFFGFPEKSKIAFPQPMFLKKKKKKIFGSNVFW